MEADGTNRRIQELLDLMQKTLECSICLEMLTNPVSTSCGHQFCRFCLLGCLEKKRQVPCPLCKKPVTKRSLMERNNLGEMVNNVRNLITGFQTDTGILFSPPRGPQITGLLPCTPDSLENQPNNESAKRRLSVDRKSTRKNVRQTRNKQVETRDVDSASCNVSSSDTGTENINIENIKNIIQTTTENQLPGADNDNSPCRPDSLLQKRQLLHCIEAGDHCLTEHRGGRTRGKATATKQSTASGQDSKCGVNKSNVDNASKEEVSRTRRKNIRVCKQKADIDISAHKTRLTVAGQQVERCGKLVDVVDHGRGSVKDVEHKDSIANVKDENNRREICTTKEVDVDSKFQENPAWDNCTNAEALAKCIEECAILANLGTQLEDISTCKDVTGQENGIDNLEDQSDSVMSENHVLVQSGKTESDTCSLFKTPQCMKKTTLNHECAGEAVKEFEKMSLRPRTRIPSTTDNCNDDAKVTLTPDNVATEDQKTVPFQSQSNMPSTGKTYSKKDRTVHKRESKANKKVVEWLKSINKKNDDNKQSDIETIGSIVTGKRNKKILKVQQEEHLLGQRLKNFAKQHAGNTPKQDKLFGFKDFDYSPNEIDSEVNKQNIHPDENCDGVDSNVDSVDGVDMLNDDNISNPSISGLYHKNFVPNLYHRYKTTK